MVKQLALYHLLPFVLACALVWASLFAFKSLQSETSAEPVRVEGVQKQTRGFYPNLGRESHCELDFIASLSNKEQLTIFGSSEFTDSPYCPYFFLPDSLGIPTLGVGHAFHQSFSMLCELLAANEYVEGANICVVISPSWFATEGTNSEAFVEFVLPRFLDGIATDKKLEDRYKIAVGEYIHRHKEEFTGLSNSMILLQDAYYLSNPTNLNYVKARLRTLLLERHGNLFPVSTVEYKALLMDVQPVKKWEGDRAKRLDDLQHAFVSSITTNSMYVNDTYYNTWVLDEDGTEMRSEVDFPDLEDNQELEDFKLLVDFLHSRSANCSFVILPLNPYYYDHCERNRPLIDTLTRILDDHRFPYLNLYVENKENYDPGVLMDVMHPGDYGWMKVNFFLDSLYHDK